MTKLKQTKKLTPWTNCFPRMPRFWLGKERVAPYPQGSYFLEKRVASSRLGKASWDTRGFSS